MNGTQLQGMFLTPHSDWTISQSCGLDIITVVKLRIDSLRHCIQYKDTVQTLNVLNAHLDTVDAKYANQGSRSCNLTS